MSKGYVGSNPQDSTRSRETRISVHYGTDHIPYQNMVTIQSMAETAGLALGAVSLFVSVTKAYGHFETIKNAPKDVQELSKDLEGT